MKTKSFRGGGAWWPAEPTCVPRVTWGVALRLWSASCPDAAAGRRRVESTFSQCWRPRRLRAPWQERPVARPCACTLCREAGAHSGRSQFLRTLDGWMESPRELRGRLGSPWARPFLPPGCLSSETPAAAPAAKAPCPESRFSLQCAEDPFPRLSPEDGLSSSQRSFRLGFISSFPEDVNGTLQGA